MDIEPDQQISSHFHRANITKVKSYYSGKTIWVTGASSGMGEQLAYQLSTMDARLILSSRKKEDLERVMNNCAHPEKVSIITLDQAEENSVRNAASEAFEKNAHIDILFNNGGISQRSNAMETSMDITRKIMEVDFFANVLLSKLVAEKMLLRKSGHIVVTSSLAGKWGFYLRSSYAAAKHALHGYYDSLRMETEKDGLQITLVVPGLIATEISRNALDKNGKQTNEMDPNQANGLSAEETARRILKGVAAGKTEFGVGGSEMLGLKVKRFFPKMFERILRKRAAR